MKKTTLRNRLKMGEVVKIGFKSAKEDNKDEGSKFIFCGKVSKKALQFIEYRSTIELVRLKNARSKALKMSAQGKKSDDNWKERAEKLDHKIKTWVDYLDREVKEDYKSVLNDDVSIILCDGTERGSYWLISEFTKDHPWNEGQDEKPKEKHYDINTLSTDYFISTVFRSSKSFYE